MYVFAVKLDHLENDTIKDQELKESLVEKSKVLEETRRNLGRQQERIQVCEDAGERKGVGVGVRGGGGGATQSTLYKKCVSGPIGRKFTVFHQPASNKVGAY